MNYWLAITAGCLQDTFIFRSTLAVSICDDDFPSSSIRPAFLKIYNLTHSHVWLSFQSWQDRRWKSACAEAFEICTSRCVEQFQTLLLPVWYLSHFFLLVAYPKDRTWDYYNTFGWRKRHFEYARQFVRPLTLLPASVLMYGRVINFNVKTIAEGIRVYQVWVGRVAWARKIGHADHF